MSTPPESAAQPTGTCFVVMGFGKKTDFESGRVLDLDQSYRSLIKPAVEAAGLKCIRADEIVHSGLIDVPMYEQLLRADVVVADLSTSNRNAIYELGVRHALRPYTTVVIAEEGMMKSSFFDLNHIVFRNYRHLGEDIGVNEARRFTGELTSALREILAQEPKLRGDSPVYKFIARLIPPALAEALGVAAAAAAKDVGAGGGATAAARDAPTAEETHSVLMRRVDEAQGKGDFLKAKVLLEEIRELRKAKDPAAPAAQPPSEKPEDPYILQRLALATYKSRYPTAGAALQEARDLLALLEPHTSNDTETLGLWGSVHKQLWGVTQDGAHLDEAVRAYKRGFYLRNDHYNGINFAFLLNVRAAHATDLAEATADFVQARRIRTEVLEICQAWLAATPVPKDEGASDQAATAYRERRYWVLATMAEAAFGVGDEAQGQRWLEEAQSTRPQGWMWQTTQEQIGQLQPLLASFTPGRRQTQFAPSPRARVRANKVRGR